MTVPACIRLKENYFLIQDPSDSNGLLVYDSVRKLAFYKIKVPDAKNLLEMEINQYAHRFQSLNDLSRLWYGKVLVMLFRKSPDLFEQAESVSELVNDAVIGDIMDTVDFNQFFLTYSFSEKRNLAIPVILWGNSVTNLQLFNLFANLSIKVSLVISKDDLVGIQEMSFSGWKLGEKLEEALNRQYSHKVNANVFLIENEGDCQNLLEEKGLHIVHNCMLLSQDGKNFMQQLEASTPEAILYYGMHENELTIGPLVIPGESATYEDFMRIYQKRQRNIPIVMNFIATGMIVRICYFVLVQSLKYLAADVQIPINSAFCIDQYTMNSKVIPIIGGTSNEDSSEKYSKILS